MGPPTDPGRAIRCRGVIMEFGRGATRTPVLRGTDLDVAVGEMVLLVGPSGCGKTTLLSVVAGLLSPKAGEVEVFGTRLDRLRRGRLVDFRAANIGFVFQQFNLLPTLTAAQNAAVPLVALGMPNRRAEREAIDLLGRLGIGDQAHKLPRALSGGQQQRVAIARALVHRPRLILCDEPTAALDAETGQTVMALIRELALGPDRSVLVVTHDNRVFPFGDRIVAMSDGRTVAVGASSLQEVA